MTETAALVDSGSFKVDRKQALDKLMRFQLFDPHTYMLAWVQAAVAGGAQMIWVSSQADSLELRFDGKPWRQEELRDPYRFLFEEDPQGLYGRNRDLAVGILSALRLKPSSVELLFSDGEDLQGHRLRILDVTRESLEEHSPEELNPFNNPFNARFRMAIRIGLPPTREIELLQQYCQYCPARIETPGGTLRPANPSPFDLLISRQAFSQNGISGEIFLSPRTLSNSLIDFVTNGVTVSSEELILRSLQVCGHVRNDSLNKSISQAGLIKDENYHKSFALIEQEAEKLFRLALKDAKELAEKVGESLSEQRFRWHWMPWEARSFSETMMYRFLDPSGTMGGSLSGGDDLFAGTQVKANSIHTLSLLVAAIRASCLARKANPTAGAAALPGELLNAPLLFDTEYRPLTLRQLEAQRIGVGYVPYAGHALKSGNARIALIVRESDRLFLESYFGSDALPHSSDTSALETPRIKPTLDEPGLLVTLPFRTKLAIGEIGLSLNPHTRASRIRWLRDGFPLAISTWPLGGLRLEAVVDSSSLQRAPNPETVDQEAVPCLSAIASAAPEAYRRLSTAYAPSSATPRQAIIREHLLDLAAVSWDHSREAWLANDWLEDMALFRDVEGRMLSMRDLRIRAVKCEKVFLRASTHPDSLLEITEGFPDHVKAIFGSSRLILGIAPPPRRAPAADTEIPKKPRPRPAPAQTAPPTRPPAPPPPQHAPPAEDTADLVSDPAGPFKHWLRALSLRKSCPLSTQEIDSIAFDSQDSKDFLLPSAAGDTIINTAHPMARLLESAGGLIQHLPYLTSIVYTAINRRRAALTDADDMKLQMALTEYLLQALEPKKPPARKAPESRRTCQASTKLLFSDSAARSAAMPPTKVSSDPKSSLEHPDRFADRHLGPSARDAEAMLKTLGRADLDSLMDAVVPSAIRAAKPLSLEAAASEHEALTQLRALAARNQVSRSYLGTGYHDSITPAVLVRNILENPGWYTAYTPYQAEISQGRLEALLNFQTMIISLTGLEVANASLLDEATAAAEAMTMSFAAKGSPAGGVFCAADDCHPQTLALLRTRAEPLGIAVQVGPRETLPLDSKTFGLLLQYPATDGAIYDFAPLAEKAHAAGALVTVAADPLALTLLRTPGEFGTDIAVGSTQRFGLPLGFGGPHAAYLATRDAYKRQMPGRIVGVSKDAQGGPALRLALQTREQHIRREKATSNICTAQVLLAVIASMYAVYHGPDGLKRIALRIHAQARLLAAGLAELGWKTGPAPFFDTVRVAAGKDRLSGLLAAARSRGINLRDLDGESIVIALDEKTSRRDVMDILEVFSGARRPNPQLGELPGIPASLARQSPLLEHPVFNRYHCETEMLRYLHRLESKDLSLNTSMISLGSCTMKLSAAAEMLPITWPEFSDIHPFAPAEQSAGYREMISQLEHALCEITGFSAVSLQPNAGSQGEYSGLLTIRKYHQSRGQGGRNICLIPHSAHGTNPASAVMAGMKTVEVRCDEAGNIDLADLKAKAEEHKKNLAALMVTYPSTHGVFEESIKEICRLVHDNGGQVYMDGANMNAQVGLCRPAEIGADVCHLNLHKTFAIPHGGGGPGVGPIGTAKHLAQFLPGHPLVKTGGQNPIGPVSAAPWGSASVLPITWMYIRMMGPEGLTQATRIAILNANYIAKRLDEHYPVLYKGKNGFVAHECILDLRHFKDSGVTAEDVAKRLMDYGYHAPTLSWPVAGTLMVEPTESESKAELDRFCEAMILIRQEIRAIEQGRMDKTDNALKNAPHTALMVTASAWSHPYTREAAAFPAPWLKEHKFWPAVRRIDNPYGDRNLVCSRPISA